MKIWKKVKQYPNLGLVILAFVAFIALGLPDGLLGVGWPSIRAGFSVPLDAIGMFLAAAVTGYMTSSFLSGFLLSRVGVGRILAASCFLTGLESIRNVQCVSSGRHWPIHRAHLPSDDVGNQYTGGGS